MKARGYAAHSATGNLEPFDFERREAGPDDVAIEIRYCGICHSDIHQARNEWRNSVYPVIPGHEIVGKVTAVGNQVKSFKPGDLAAVGCMVGSCGDCPTCGRGLEQYCQRGPVWTYNSPDKHGTTKTTYGGYSNRIVVDQNFVLKVPANLDLAATAPLLCAGITLYSPLRTWGAGPGKKVGIVGLGGLGHMGVKLAHAMGAHVVLFTTSQKKAEDGRRLGADEVVVSTSEDQMKKHAGSFDLIVNTVSVPHSLDAYLVQLGVDGTMCLLGAPSEPHPSPGVFNLIFARRRLAGSLIGGIRETQEMLDFCGAHKIVSDIEMTPIQGVNEAYTRMLRSDVKYRFVIDMESLR